MKRFKFFLIVLVILVMFSNFAYADLGPKPSITVYLENISNSNYIIDLLVEEDEYIEYSDPIIERYEEYSNSNIYKYNEEGWIAKSMRDYLLWGDIEGNDNYKHRFTYFGVPDEFKVIVEFEDGTLFVSDVIEKTDFDFEVIVDIESKDIIKYINYEDVFSKILDILPILLSTFLMTGIIEIIIALIMKLKKQIGKIAVVNLITQILLYIVLYNIFDNYDFMLNYLTIFLITEVFIFIIEYLIYRKWFKDVSKKKILIYTLVANLITMLLTFTII